MDTTEGRTVCKILHFHIAPSIKTKPKLKNARAKYLICIQEIACCEITRKSADKQINAEYSDQNQRAWQSECTLYYSLGKKWNLAAPDGLIRWGLFYSIGGYVLHFFFSFLFVKSIGELLMEKQNLQIYLPVVVCKK